MVAITNRVTTLFDFKESGGGLKKIRTDVQQADGAVGKFKAGWQGAMTTVKAYGAEAALAVGSTLVVGAIKVGQEFAAAAISAGQFADATGLSTEEASRWISVADDLGLNADDVQKAFLRLNKEIGEGDGVAEEYGLTLKRTADGAADVNGTMLDTIATINKIKDPTERARVAQELFGRSYANIAEIIFNDAEKVRLALESTSEAQIFDNDEVRKAREYRAAMDQLGDVLVDLKHTVGEVVLPVLTEMATQLADLKNPVEDARGWFGDLPGPIKAVGQAMKFSTDMTMRAFNPLKAYSDLTEALAEEMPEASEQVRKWAAQIIAQKKAQELGIDVLEEAIEVTDGFTDAQVAVETAIRQARYEVEHSNVALDRARAFAQRAAEFVQNLGTKWDQLKGKMSDRSAFLDVEDAFDSVQTAAVEAWDAAANGAEDAEQKVRAQERSVIDLKNKVIDYSQQVGNLPDQVVTNILSLIDQGKLAEAEWALARLERSRQVNYTPVIQPPRTPGGNPYMDSGGAGQAGNIVAEKRAEFVNGSLVSGPGVMLGGSASVTSGASTEQMLRGFLAETRQGGGVVVKQTDVKISVSVAAGADGTQAGRQIAEALDKYYRNGGRRV